MAESDTGRDITRFSYSRIATSLGSTTAGLGSITGSNLGESSCCCDAGTGVPLPLIIPAAMRLLYNADTSGIAGGAGASAGAGARTGTGAGMTGTGGGWLMREERTDDNASVDTLAKGEIAGGGEKVF